MSMARSAQAMQPALRASRATTMQLLVMKLTRTNGKYNAWSCFFSKHSSVQPLADSTPQRENEGSLPHINSRTLNKNKKGQTDSEASFQALLRCMCTPSTRLANACSEATLALPSLKR
eukprot:193449-Amphidinium_carterae.1